MEGMTDSGGIHVSTVRVCVRLPMRLNAVQVLAYLMLTPCTSNVWEDVHTVTITPDSVALVVAVRKRSASAWDDAIATRDTILRDWEEASAKRIRVAATLD